MVMYYAVEFPLEDAMSKGLHIVPENKVKVENGRLERSDLPGIGESRSVTLVPDLSLANRLLKNSK